MHVLVRVIALACILAFPLAPLRAEEPIDPARLEAAMALLQAIGAAKQMDDLAEFMITQFASSTLAVEESKKAEAKKTLDAFSEKIRSYRPEMQKELATRYARRFTIDELKAITAFYRSPTGMKFIAAAPELPELMHMGGEIGTRFGLQAMQEARALEP